MSTPYRSMQWSVCSHTCAFELCLAADIPSAPLLAARQDRFYIDHPRNIPLLGPLHVPMVWTDPPYHRSPLPGCPMDPHNPCIGLAQTRPITETDVVAHPPTR